jgi:hypothetical protein
MAKVGSPRPNTPNGPGSCGSGQKSGFSKMGNKFGEGALKGGGGALGDIAVRKMLSGGSGKAAGPGQAPTALSGDSAQFAAHDQAMGMRGMGMQGMGMQGTGMPSAQAQQKSGGMLDFLKKLFARIDD